VKTPAPAYDHGLVTVRRSTIICGLFVATLITGWSAGATWLLLARDSFTAHLVKRETARQYAYEDRIAALKTEIDKLSGRQLVNQDGVESRIAELVTRQALIESRTAMVATVADALSGAQLASGRAARTAAAAQPTAGSSATVPQTTYPKAAVTGSLTTSPGAGVSSFAPSSRPMPVPDMPGLRRDPERRGGQTAGWDQSLLDPNVSLEERLQAVRGSLEVVQARHARAVSRMEASVASAYTSLRAVISDVGLDPDRLAMTPRPGATGGPFIPASLNPNAGPVEAGLARIGPRIAAIEALRQVTVALPLRRPMGPEAEQTSAFGHRLDPFTRGIAMHSGIDFRAETGTPVRAGGAGRVILADYSGGYGNMVEIDHGHGVTTRYAHLSRILVADGQQVAAGAIVGHVGSTGRSTGPHLHYETRIEGDAVDPQRFLRAGQRFLSDR
jgi:murein DD-endopeptidase MepM/ murein hydrolase activator NlpD